MTIIEIQNANSEGSTSHHSLVSRVKFLQSLASLVTFFVDGLGEASSAHVKILRSEH